MNTITTRMYWNNSVSDWLFAVGILIVSFIAIKVFRYIVLQRVKAWSEKTVTTWDDFLVTLIEKSAIPILYITAVYSSVTYLTLPEKAKKIIHVAYLVCVTFFVVKIITAAFKKFVFSFIQTQENGDAKKQQASGLIVIVNCVIWVLGAVFLIDNLGYDVTTLVAGLGIGGIAIALAAQAILGDLFSYFVIFFDRPFEIGDFIVVDDKSGTIEHIGIKTTRVRTLSGEQLICSNTDLTNSRLHNFKRLQRRRIVFSLGVTYQTKYEQLSAISGMVKEIIDQTEDVTFDRGHFSGYGDFSLNFEFVYYVLNPDYAFYMDRQQEIYLQIFKSFEAQGIEFAYPTQTLFVQSEQADAAAINK